MPTAVATRKATRPAKTTTRAFRRARARLGVAKKVSRICVDLPYGHNAAAGQEPLFAVLTQLETYSPTIDCLLDRDEAKYHAAEINGDRDLGMRGWACKIVGVTVEVTPALAKRLADNDGPVGGKFPRQPR